MPLNGEYMSAEKKGSGDDHLLKTRYSVCERSLKRKLFFISLQRFEFLMNNVELSLKISINIE